MEEGFFAQPVSNLIALQNKTRIFVIEFLKMRQKKNIYCKQDFFVILGTTKRSFSKSNPVTGRPHETEDV